MEEKIKRISINESEAKETLYQYDKGQIIEFEEEIANETHILMSNAKSKKADRKLIMNNRVEVLDELLEESGTLVINVQIVDESSETTTKTIRMRVLPRKDACEGIEKENQQTFVEQIQEIMTATKAIAENVQERAENGEFNGEKGEKGDKGDKGDVGPQGEQGPPGEPGYTPVKGKDYFTDEEKAEIEQAVADKVDLINDESNSTDKTWSSNKINTELSKKQDTLTAGDYITIEDNVISVEAKNAVETIGGNLEQLDTTDKSSYVAAINELNAKTKMGDWELITEIDVTEKIGVIEITTNSEGQSFEYDDIYIVAQNVVGVGNWIVSLRTTTSSSISNTLQFTNANAVTSTARHFHSKLERMFGVSAYEYDLSYKNSTGGYVNTIHKGIIFPKYECNESTKINWVRIHFSSTNTITSGKIRIYGRNRR